MDSVYIVVQNHMNDTELQSKIESLLDGISVQLNEVGADFVSVQLKNLFGNNYFGKFSCCGAWASDSRIDGFVEEFSNGAVIENKWYYFVYLIPIKITLVNYIFDIRGQFSRVDKNSVL